MQFAASRYRVRVGLLFQLFARPSNPLFVSSFRSSCQDSSGSVKTTAVPIKGVPNYRPILSDLSLFPCIASFHFFSSFLLFHIRSAPNEGADCYALVLCYRLFALAYRARVCRPNSSISQNCESRSQLATSTNGAAISFYQLPAAFVIRSLNRADKNMLYASRACALRGLAEYKNTASPTCSLRNHVDKLDIAQLCRPAQYLHYIKRCANYRHCTFVLFLPFFHNRVNGFSRFSRRVSQRISTRARAKRNNIIIVLTIASFASFVLSLTRQCYPLPRTFNYVNFSYGDIILRVT
jgi:hypothetical protein